MIYLPKWQFWRQLFPKSKPTSNHSVLDLGLNFNPLCSRPLALSELLLVSNSHLAAANHNSESNKTCGKFYYYKSL